MVAAESSDFDGIDEFIIDAHDLSTDFIQFVGIMNSRNLRNLSTFNHLYRKSRTLDGTFPKCIWLRSESAQDKQSLIRNINFALGKISRSVSMMKKLK